MCFETKNKMNKNIQTLKYIVSDSLSVALSWFLFNLFRKIYIESPFLEKKIPFVFNNYFLVSVIVLIVFWLLLYTYRGYYYNVYRKSRIQ